MKSPTPKERAAIATLMFVLFGVIGAVIVIAKNDLVIAWPPMLFYAMLVWNDYYSIEHFSKIIPPGKTSQVASDIVLVVLHFVSVFLFVNPLLFAVTMTVLFILAVLKYAGDLPSVKNSRALYRKVKIDALGALISALTLAGMFLGYPWQSTIAWTAIFVCASIYVIIINPLYKDNSRNRMIKISFIIPAYNEESYIRHCLDAIIKEIGGREGYEIIVADNNSTDRTREIVAKEYLAVTLIHEPKRGANSAREAGFAASHGALVAFLDSDTELGKGWIDRAERAFAKDPKLVCLSGPFIYYDLPFAIRALVQGFYIGTYLVYLMNNYLLRDTSMIQGGTEIVRRDALTKIGGHNVSLTFYGDDADLARRLRTVGKVRWSFAFSMRSSGRRLAKEGTFTMGLRYAINYFWITLFNKPFTTTSTEVRFVDKQTMYKPESKTKEWMIAIALIVMAFAIVEALIYAFSRFRL